MATSDSHRPNNQPLTFRQAAPPGFGDRDNSWAWSMLWWRGALYVGTNRAWSCAQRAATIRGLPGPLGRVLGPILSAAPDPTMRCPDDDQDLPLRAEIWRWTPEDDHWERVYQSPQDVPIPGHPGRFTAREVGYRYMSAFVEPDGTEALYVAGVNARSVFHPVPAPRLLRSTDGAHFAGVPQDPGTFLGELDSFTFRSLVSFRERLFVLTGHLNGSGILLEAADPAAGNDAFRQVSPPGMLFFEIIVFNDHLYLGVHDPQRGYAVVKTDASGDPPYRFTPVVTDGGFCARPRSERPISMHVFAGCLYVGMDRPRTEIIRIAPDDSWDLIVGEPRQTPNGLKTPLSGLDAGFNSWLNGHIWRMQAHEGRLYVGTMNMSPALRRIKLIDPANLGFDLYVSDDGRHFAPVTTCGFGHLLDIGVRTFASTPHGLFLGTANNWQACHIWQGLPADLAALPSREEDERPPTERQVASPRPAPQHLAVEPVAEGLLLYWTPAPNSARYHIWRAVNRDERPRLQTFPRFRRLTGLLRFIRRALPLLGRISRLAREVYLPPLPPRIWTYLPYERVATTTTTSFLDEADPGTDRFVYYVQAEWPDGARSAASSLAVAPPPRPPVTFAEALAHVAAHPEIAGDAGETLQAAAALAEAGDAAAAAAAVTALTARLPGDNVAVRDLAAILSRLELRLRRPAVPSTP